MYRDVLGKKPESEILDTIQAAEDLKNLRKHNGWTRIEKFMSRQEEGANEVLDVDISTITLLSIPKLFNSFLKYLYIVMERRAYRKIRNFMRVTIQNGEKYAERRAKAETAKK